MAQKKISELTAVVLASGSAVLPIVQDGTTFKITFANLTGSILNVATAVTASHALTALTASYAVSASHEITYELSSSFAETATSASHALASNTATSASFATTATSASHALTSNTTISASFATSASFAGTATTALSAPGIRVNGLIGTGSEATNVKIIGFTGVNVVQVDSTTAIAYIQSSSFATTASYAVTASVASALYKPTGTISVGIGADSNIVQISGSLIQLGNPTLYTETLVSRQLAVSGGIMVHNTLGNGFYTVGVDNAGSAQIGVNNFLNMSLKNDGRSTLYNGVHISASISVQDGEVLTLKPTHPLPSYLIATGSFAVSASNPAKPYFWDGNIWNPLY